MQDNIHCNAQYDSLAFPCAVDRKFLAMTVVQFHRAYTAESYLKIKYVQRFYHVTASYDLWLSIKDDSTWKTLYLVFSGHATLLTVIVMLQQLLPCLKAVQSQLNAETKRLIKHLIGNPSKNVPSNTDSGGRVNTEFDLRAEKTLSNMPICISKFKLNAF